MARGRSGAEPALGAAWTCNARQRSIPECAFGMLRGSFDRRIDPNVPEMSRPTSVACISYHDRALMIQQIRVVTLKYILNENVVISRLKLGAAIWRCPHLCDGGHIRGTCTMVGNKTLLRARQHVLFMNSRLLACTRPLCILFPSSVALAPFAVPTCNIRLKTDVGAKLLAAACPPPLSSPLPATKFVVMKPMLSKSGAEYGDGKAYGAFEYCYGRLQNLKYLVGVPVGRAAPFLFTGYVRDSDGQPHGYGVLSSLHHPRTLLLSVYHQGEFRDGVIHGQGVQMLFAFDSWVHTIEGQFAGGISRGYCRSIYLTHGNVCEGFMEKGEFHGSGTKICADGSSGSGMWDKGKFQGDGCPSRHAASGCAPIDFPPVKTVKEVGGPRVCTWLQPKPDVLLFCCPICRSCHFFGPAVQVAAAAGTPA
jgi:hypothetical protein